MLKNMIFILNTKSYKLEFLGSLFTYIDIIEIKKKCMYISKRDKK